MSPFVRQSDAWIDRQVSHQAEHGFCFWAAEERSTGSFVGAVGLLIVGYEAHFTPAVEIGWRLSREHWGKGFAIEAARGVLSFGFDNLALTEVVANAVASNANSRKVMEKLGMVRDPADDFLHPLVSEGSPSRQQVLYRLTMQRYRNRSAAGSATRS